MGGGIAACAIAIVLAACSNPEYDGRTDTVYSLSTPSVTAKAYPGVNIVSWKPVSGAQSYNVCIYEEGTFKKSSIVKDKCYFADSNLVDGKKYKYTVEAVGERNMPARSVYVTNSSLGEASAKAIVPPAGTNALELATYEKGYDANAEKKMALTPEDVTVRQYKDSVYVSFPAKAYLKYGVVVYSIGLPQEIEGVYDWKATVEDENACFNDATLTVNFPITSNGKYQLAVKVRSRDWYDGYVYEGEWLPGSVVANYEEGEVEAKEITIDKLVLEPETLNVSANYQSDEKTVRVSFEPAKKDGVYVPTSWYKVYRRVQGEFATTEITNVSKLPENIVEWRDGREENITKYYVDDTIADNKKAYEYIVVVGNDGKYGYAQKKQLQAKTSLDEKLLPSSINAEYLYTEHFSSKANNLVRVSFTPVKKDGDYVPTSWYKVYRSIKDKNEKTEVTSADNKVVATVNTDNKAVVYYVTDTIDDPTLSYTYSVVVENDGIYSIPVTKDLVSVGSKPFVDISVWGYQKFHLKDDNGAYDDESNRVYESTVVWNISGSNLKKDEIKSITLYQVNGRNSSAVLFADEATTNVKLADVSGTNGVYEVSTTVNLDEGSYVYLVVKAERDGCEVTYASNYDPVNALTIKKSK